MRKVAVVSCHKADAGTAVRSDANGMQARRATTMGTALRSDANPSTTHTVRSDANIIGIRLNNRQGRTASTKSGDVGEGAVAGGEAESRSKGVAGMVGAWLARRRTRRLEADVDDEWIFVIAPNHQEGGLVQLVGECEDTGVVGLGTRGAQSACAMGAISGKDYAINAICRAVEHRKRQIRAQETLLQARLLPWNASTRLQVCVCVCVRVRMWTCAGL